MSFSAKVKNVLSGDTIVLTPAKTATVPAPERVLTLSYVRGDSFESKEFLRQLLIGKEIKFSVDYKTPNGKEFGDVQSPIFMSLIEYLVEQGQVKLKDNIEESDFVNNLRALEAKAESKGLGVWGNRPNIEMITLDESLIKKTQSAPITSIIEKVISGDRVIARIIVNKHQHVSTPILLAGIKCPRTDSADQLKLLTTTAHQAKQFVEDKLLVTKAVIKVSIIGENQGGLPVGIFIHPSGNNIHEKMLEYGFGEVVDWQSSLIGSATMSVLRKAEQTAKALGHGIYATGKPVQSLGTVNGGGKVTSKQLRPGLTVESVLITKIIQADTVNVKLPSGDEITVQLASLRGPKPNDTTITTNSQTQLALVNSAREFVRQYAIGKTATMYIDGFRKENKELGFESRFAVSLKFGNVDLSEVIVSKGWAGVIRHGKQASDERSLNWDKLIELEQEQKSLGKHGIHFKGDITKVLIVGTRIVDVSENLARAKSFFSNLRQKGRVTGYHVEFIPNVNRVKLFNPKEGLKLTLILGGLANEKSEYGEEGLKFVNSKLLQKPVEFDIYDMDKLGGFIGNVYVNSNSLVPFQVNLLEQGYVRIHDFAISANKFETDLVKAEDSAKASKRRLWQHESNIAKALETTTKDIKPVFHDIEVTFIDEQGIIYYQQLDTITRNKFQAFKQDFDEFHKQNPSSTSASYDLPFNLTKAPKKNELVSVKLDDNGKYYRGRILSHDKHSNLFEVRHLDYGNVDQVPLSSLRVLPPFFNPSTIEIFNHSCKLRYVTLPPSKPVDYLTDALELLDELTLDKKLVISALPATDVEYSVILYDSTESLNNKDYTINRKMIQEGLGIVSDTNTSDPLVKLLQQAQLDAEANHKGCWKYGKISFDEDLL